MSNAIHPYIQVLVELLKIAAFLLIDDNHSKGWKVLLSALMRMKPIYKQREDYVALVQEIKYARYRLSSVSRLNAYDAETKQTRLAYSLDNLFEDRVNDLMWECRMLSNDNFSFFDPSENKDSDKISLKLGGRNVDGIQ